MRAARLHGYHQPLVLEDVPVPEIAVNEVLVKVGAAGMCRTDVQLIDGYFRPYVESAFPLTLGHEIAGQIEKIGSLVPKSAGWEEGDQVVVVGGWGDGTCRHCHEGNTQICPHGKWPGFGPYGGYAEYLPVPPQYLIKIDKRFNLKAEELAPITDAGLTPYRGIKKLRDAGALGPDRILAVFGVGGLGSYAIQYAKLIGGGATVVAFGRNPEKLASAKEFGADHVISTKGKSVADIRKELMAATGNGEIDAVIDCAGATEMIQTGSASCPWAATIRPWALSGTASTFRSSRWSRANTPITAPSGAITTISARLLLWSQQGKVRHSIKTIRFEDVNENIELLRSGDVVGRAVIRY